MKSEEKTCFEQTLRSIRMPDNYYYGIASPGEPLPDNVLVFVRKTGQTFSKSRFLPRNHHHRFLIACALKGPGSGFINGCHFTINPGHGLLVFPHQLHYFLHKSEDILWMMITFELDDTAPWERLRDRVFKLSDPALDCLYRLSERFLSLQRNGIKHDRRLSLLTALLLDELNESADVRDKPVVLEGTHRVIDLVEKMNIFINANLERIPDIHELAQKFSYSPSHLRQLYRRTTGMTINSYIEHMRMRRAQSYLLSGSMNVSEIAQTCGYESLYAFSRAFKRHTGCSPVKYRSRIFNSPKAPHPLQPRHKKTQGGKAATKSE